MCRKRPQSLRLGSFLIWCPQNLQIFLTLSHCPHLDLIYTIKFTQPPYYVRFSMTPLPPSMWTSYMEAPLVSSALPAWGHRVPPAGIQFVNFKGRTEAASAARPPLSFKMPLISAECRADAQKQCLVSIISLGPGTIHSAVFVAWGSGGNHRGWLPGG